jgi:hypothetical protein
MQQLKIGKAAINYWESRNEYLGNVVINYRELSNNWQCRDKKILLYYLEI